MNIRTCVESSDTLQNGDYQVKITPRNCRVDETGCMIVRKFFVLKSNDSERKMPCRALKEFKCQLDTKRKGNDFQFIAINKQTKIDNNPRERTFERERETLMARVSYFGLIWFLFALYPVLESFGLIHQSRVFLFSRKQQMVFKKVIHVA